MDWEMGGKNERLELIVFELIFTLFVLRKGGMRKKKGGCVGDAVYSKIRKLLKVKLWGERTEDQLKKNQK